MTCPLTDDQTLAELDSDIPCDVDGCDRPAVVAAKGCGDKAHLFFCREDYAEGMAKLLALLYGRLCNWCWRPILELETHFSEVWL